MPNIFPNGPYNGTASGVNLLYSPTNPAVPFPVDPANFGAVYGPFVSQAQCTINLTALHAARDAAIARGNGEIELSGFLYVNGQVNLSNLGQTRIGMHGDSMLGSGLCYIGPAGLDYFVTLRGTSYFHMENLTINCRDITQYGLYCARDVYPNTAGKHTFINVRIISATKASHLNFASEENTYIKCQFQGTPIGCVVTAYPPNANIEVNGADPVDWTQIWQSSISHYFYGCAFYGSRCGLMVCDSVVHVLGSLFQSAATAEAGVILDGTHEQCEFSDIQFDYGGAPVAFAIGQYNDALPNFLSLSGSLSVHPTLGTAYIKAKYLSGSHIGPIIGFGLVVGFVLEDANCKGNTFIDCRYTDGVPITVDDALAAASNLQICRGRITFLGGSVGGIDPLLYHFGTVNRLRFEGSLYAVPTVTGAIVMASNVIGEGSARWLLSGDGMQSWSSGAAAVDTNLYRSAANTLKTDDEFIATGAVVTATKAGVPADGDVATAQDGAMIVDTVAHRLYVRSGGLWKWTALT